jgi:hypothetical protein
MMAVDLETAMAERGYACRVEAHDRLAILTLTTSHPREAGDLAAFREAALALARAKGFTHVALELPAGPLDDAALPRP